MSRQVRWLRGESQITEPGADRETLVGMIYTHVLCIRATVTIFMGDKIIRVPCPRGVRAEIAESAVDS